jgi:hypothetical protein
MMWRNDRFSSNGPLPRMTGPTKITAFNAWDLTGADLMEPGSFLLMVSMNVKQTSCFTVRSGQRRLSGTFRLDVLGQTALGGLQDLALGTELVAQSNLEAPAANATSTSTNFNLIVPVSKPAGLNPRIIVRLQANPLNLPQCKFEGGGQAILIRVNNTP